MVSVASLVYPCLSVIKTQVSLARLGAGFGSALADIFQTESLSILAERLSQWEIRPPLRRACHNHPLKKWGASHTEITSPIYGRFLYLCL